MNTPQPRIPRRLAWLALALPLLLATQPARAATDLADVPLFTSSSSTVKPNIMFILDNSGSMARDYMPDDADFGGSNDHYNDGKYGGRAPQCNGLAYNPTVTYSPPIDSTGASASSGSLSIFDPNNFRTGSQRTPASPTAVTVASSGTLTFRFNTTNNWFAAGDTVLIYSTDDTARYMEGTVTSWSQVVSNTRDLVVTVNYANGVGAALPATAGNLRVAIGATPGYFAYSGSQTRLGYQYTSGGVITSTTFYQECNSNIGSTPGSGVFSYTRVSAGSSNAQNYANWYQYYRTRILMAKSAVSLAFKDIGDKYRVGYSTISKKTAAPDTNFLDVTTFDATQKAAFYTSLNAATPSGNTPLRGALSKAGQYFANKAPSQTSDPIQYSCQKNFAILTTDGYWNTGAENTTYGAFGVTGAEVGQQDAPPTEYPMRDGAEPQTTTTSTWTRTRTVQTQTSTVTKSYTGATQTVKTDYTTGGATGSKSTTYTPSSAGNSSISANCSGSGSSRTCTYTVTTATPHGLPVLLPLTTAITIVDAENTGGSNNFNGSFTATRTGTNTYTFTRTGNSAPSGTASPAGTTLLRNSGALSCASGQGVVSVSTTQVDTFPSTRTTTVNATETVTTSYVLKQTITDTPYTRVVVVQNGATVSDVSTPGTPVVTGPTTLTPPANLVTTGSQAFVSSGAGPNGTVTTNTGPTQQCSATATNTSNVSATVVAAKPASTTVGPTSTTNPATTSAAGPTTTPLDSTVDGAVASTSVDGSTGGASNTLADVAMYYYKTDLRTTDLNNCAGSLGSGTNVCKTIDIGGEDTNVVQNMVTFTLGMGVSGTLKYVPDYLTNVDTTVNDYPGLKQGTARWPNPENSTNGGDPTNVDDLWHAAVNGRGQYFSAGDPTAVVTSLQTALRRITEIRGSSSAAATSTLQPVSGDNDVFVAEFTSGKWIGDVKRFAIDPSTGQVSTTASWSAATVLAGRDTATDPRKIYYFKKAASGNTGTLREFNYTNLTADTLNGNFDGFCNKAGAGGGIAPTQCATLTVAQKTTANAGTNLVEWLRGAGTNNAVYRTRDGALGDVINASPLFVGPPKFKYTENGYATYANLKRNRDGLLLVGSNDGMLHAFDRITGVEKWAFMPSTVLPNLYKMADSDYASSHHFFVDGSPQVGDVFDGTNWRTIVVGGLNKGGKIYYALDVTDPANPVALWEFSDANLGFTFGNPVITKRKDGTWVVAFGSGYNNVGDGNGHLFVVDAITGQRLVDMPTYTSGTTAAGSTTSPSGLARINAYIASDIDNTAKVFYGGDLLGNVWRFDIDSNVAPFNQSFLLATLQKDSKAQPVTTKLEIADVNYQGSSYVVVYAGTGRYLGTGDLSNTDGQSVYAIKDVWGTTGLGDVRASGKMVQQTITAATGGGGPIRKASTNPVDWSTKDGWMVDLPSAGERVNVNMVLSLNVLSVATNIPTTDVCDAGGRSWLYQFDIGTGSAVSNAADGAVAIPLGNVLVAGLTVVQLADGRTVTISTLSDTTLRTDTHPPPPVAGTLRRTSWRELAN